MRRVVRLDWKSTITIFIVFYALVGLFVASKAAITGGNTLVCPFGFAFPMTQAIITITLHLPHPATWLTAGLTLITTVFYALTGLISGITVVLIYNFVARFRPLLWAQFEQDSPSERLDAQDEAQPATSPNEISEAQNLLTNHS